MESKMMTQKDAEIILKDILGRPFADADKCTGNAGTCPIEECMLCGVRDCPSNEPLHYHHDGCPACYFDRVAEDMYD